MQRYLFEKEGTYTRLYNCSSYSVEAVPLAQRQHIALGALLVVLFVIFELLYIPCLLAISRHLQHTSFKIMFYIGVLDLFGLFVAGLVTGLYAIEGAVFCSHPTQIYWMGVVGFFLWLAESMAELILAFNRCVDSWSPNVGRALFDGRRTYFWLALVRVYSVTFCWRLGDRSMTNSGHQICLGGRLFRHADHLLGHLHVLVLRPTRGLHRRFARLYVL